jgi:hypothetical protein
LAKFDLYSQQNRIRHLQKPKSEQKHRRISPPRRRTAGRWWSLPPDFCLKYSTDGTGISAFVKSTGRNSRQRFQNLPQHTISPAAAFVQGIGPPSAIF